MFVSNLSAPPLFPLGMLDPAILFSGSRIEEPISVSQLLHLPWSLSRPSSFLLPCKIPQMPLHVVRNLPNLPGTHYETLSAPSIFLDFSLADNRLSPCLLLPSPIVSQPYLHLPPFLSDLKSPVSCQSPSTKLISPFTTHLETLLANPVSNSH